MSLQAAEQNDRESFPTDDAGAASSASPDSAHAMFRRMQELLSENINATRKELKSAEALETRVSQANAENATLHARIISMEQRLAALEQEKKADAARFEKLHVAAGAEIGRVVKTLLEDRKAGIWKKKLSVEKQAKHLVAAGIVDPKWYLAHHTDVAEAGMDPAIHYIRYGAEEGRVSRAILNDAAKSD